MSGTRKLGPDGLNKHEVLQLAEVLRTFERTHGEWLRVKQRAGRHARIMQYLNILYRDKVMGGPADARP